MSSNDLSPTQAGELANAVYSLNSGNKVALTLFLNLPIFSSTPGQKKMLKAEIGGRILRAATDSFGLCAVGGGQRSNELFLVFRGTTDAHNKADMVTDARIGLSRNDSGMQVHIGFNQTFNSMKREISEFISASKTTGRIHCIGHSLGGAVATLAADWVSSSTGRPVSLYSFGQPRVGLTLFASLFSARIGRDNIHRVFHTTDPVPMVPVFPYVHSPLPGYGHRVNSSEPIHSGNAHRMQSYEDDMLAYSNWSALTSAKPIYNHESAIKLFLKSKAPNVMPNSKTYGLLEDALIWIVAKSLGKAIYGLQLAAMGIHSFIDTAAYILAKGIKLANNVSEYIMLFIKKSMRLLGMKFKEGVTKLSSNFIRYVLQSLIQHINNMARKAIRGIRN